jgi:two-component system, NtrC family, C4-dicarboxylate transport sensor histidine kinase DctB
MTSSHQNSSSGTAYGGYEDEIPAGSGRSASWRMRAVIVVLIALMAGRGLVRQFVADRALHRDGAQPRRTAAGALFRQCRAELQRNSVVPLLLARDPELINALRPRISRAPRSADLVAVRDRRGLAPVCWTARPHGRRHRPQPVGNEPQAGRLFRRCPAGEGHRLQSQRARKRRLRVHLCPRGARRQPGDRRRRGRGRSAEIFERAWAGFADAVALTDSEGNIILSTEPRWRGRTVTEALAVRDAPGAIQRALRASAEWAQDRPDAYLSGEAVMRNETRMPFRGWRLVSFTKYDSVRERVNGVLALVIMGFALLLALAFYLLSRRAWSQSALFQRESASCAAERPAAARDRRAREGAEGPGGGRADAGAIVQAGDPGRDVGGGQPRAEPAAGGDEDLSGRRPAAAAAPPPRGGAVVVPAHRRPDRTDGRDHPAAEVLCPQGRRGVRAGGPARLPVVGAGDDGAAAAQAPGADHPHAAAGAR